MKSATPVPARCTNERRLVCTVKSEKSREHVRRCTRRRSSERDPSEDLLVSCVVVEVVKSEWVRAQGVPAYLRATRPTASGFVGKLWQAASSQARLHSLVRGSVRGSLCGESPLGTPLGAPIGKPRGTPLDRPSGPPTSALPGMGTGAGRVTCGYSTPSPAILPLTLFYPYPNSTLTWPSSLRGFGR